MHLPICPLGFSGLAVNANAHAEQEVHTPHQSSHLLKFVACLPACLQMIVARRSTLVRSFMRSLLPFIPLALGYGLMLFNSWSPDTLSTMMPGSLQEGLASE